MVRPPFSTLDASQDALRAVPAACFTLGNLACGLIACDVAWHGAGVQTVQTVLLWVLAGALLDTVDGPIARRMNAAGALGARLDALADAVTFGLAPALLLMQGQSGSAGVLGGALGLLWAAAVWVRLVRHVWLTDRAAGKAGDGQVLSHVLVAGSASVDLDEDDELPAEMPRKLRCGFAGCPCPAAALALLGMLAVIEVRHGVNVSASGATSGGAMGWGVMAAAGGLAVLMVSAVAYPKPRGRDATTLLLASLAGLFFGGLAGGALLGAGLYVSRPLWPRVTRQALMRHSSSKLRSISSRR